MALLLTAWPRYYLVVLLLACHSLLLRCASGQNSWASVSVSINLEEEEEPNRESLLNVSSADENNTLPSLQDENTTLTSLVQDYGGQELIPWDVDATELNTTEESSDNSWVAVSVELPPPVINTTAPTATPSDVPSPAPSTPPSAMPSKSPTETPTQDFTVDVDVTVGVYYYAWHQSHWHQRDTPESYLRDELSPRQEPRLGEYDDSQPDVIQKHLEWSRQGNIKVWFASWWGPDSGTDRNLRNTILPLLDGSGVQLAILYEIKEWLKDVNPDDVGSGREFEKLEDDFVYLCDNFMNSPDYYRIFGRPVVWVYLTRSLMSRCALPQVIEHMRRGCARHDLYIIGDQVWGNNPEGSQIALEYLDGIANYDMYGNMGRPRHAGQEGVNRYYDRARNWKDYAAAFGTSFIPGVTPGYNDRGNRLESDHPPMSRQLNENEPEGSLFEALLQKAVPLVDSAANNLMIVNSFNEWHEDTQIEPADGGFTESPNVLTQGLRYTGYGTLYLDLLAQYTTNNSPDTAVSRSNNPMLRSGEVPGSISRQEENTPVPTLVPTDEPTNKPTEEPTNKPTEQPTFMPTPDPTRNPTEAPTKRPTEAPTKGPTEEPTKVPTSGPTGTPTKTPTKAPTANPTQNPTKNPTPDPTKTPTPDPTRNPTFNPTRNPTPNPTRAPTLNPTRAPTPFPTESPTEDPDYEANWC